MGGWLQTTASEKVKENHYYTCYVLNASIELAGRVSAMAFPPAPVAKYLLVKQTAKTNYMERMQFVIVHRNRNISIMKNQNYYCQV